MERRGQKGAYEYLIKWARYSHVASRWIPGVDLNNAQELVKKFDKKMDGGGGSGAKEGIKSRKKRGMEVEVEGGGREVLGERVAGAAMEGAQRSAKSRARLAIAEGAENEQGESSRVNSEGGSTLQREQSASSSDEEWTS